MYITCTILLLVRIRLRTRLFNFVITIIFTFSFFDDLELVFGEGHFIPFDALDVNKDILAPVQIVRQVLFVSLHASKSRLPILQSRHVFPLIYIFHRRATLDLHVHNFTYIILECLVNTHIKWLNSARCTSWDVNQSCFAFMKPVRYIGCLLGSMCVQMKNFVGESKSW